MLDRGGFSPRESHGYTNPHPHNCYTHIVFCSEHQKFLHHQPLCGARSSRRSTPWPYSPISGERVKNSAMSFLFQRPEHISSPTSPHSKRTSLHYIGTMAAAPLKVRTPEEAGTSMHPREQMLLHGTVALLRSSVLLSALHPS